MATMFAQPGPSGIGATGERKISASSLRREPTSATQVHAAAVNGDKSMLQKLIFANPELIDSGDQFGRTPLMYCVLADRPECAETLLKTGANVNKKDQGGRTALHLAAHRGNFRCLKLMISKGANWRERDKEAVTALHLATKHKSPKLVALLLKQMEPGDVDMQDENKRTALHWSASYGNAEHVKTLIKHDFNIGIPDTAGKTPLHWAASSKDPSAVQAVKYLLEAAPSVINWQDYEGRTALHLAVADGNEKVVDVLTSLEKCNVTALDNMFRTALHWAAVLGYHKIVDLLLRRNADFSSSDSNGATPLHYAAQNNHAETVKVFFSHEQVKDEPDIEGRTALMWAAGKGADDVIRVMLDNNADIHAADKTGGTGLHASALSGHAQSVKLLLDHGASVNVVDMLNLTPLFRACEMGHTEVVQVLVEGGANIDRTDRDGRSPLHWAALGGHAHICQLLIQSGRNPDVKDKSGRTPLQCAAYGGFINCMAVLMENMADPNLQDKEGMTALHWSCSSGYMDACKLLLQYSAFPNHMEFTEDRFTPLDYALLGGHHEVAQYMIEQGALSITGIQDLAATKLQAMYRGYRVRKTFLERKKLMLKHEQLRKDALAKKRAEEERRQKEEEEEQKAQEEKAPVVVKEKKVEKRDKELETKDMEPVKVKATNTKQTVVRKRHVSSDSKPGLEVCPEEILQQKRQAVQQERERIQLIRRKQHAATVIQEAWRRYRAKRPDLFKYTLKAVGERRKEAAEDEWKMEVAALTIQLAWRKYFRRKLLRSLSPRQRRILHPWSPEVLAAKQRTLVEQVYGEDQNRLGPQWYPTPPKPPRPEYMKYIPSPAAVSFNYAVDMYNPWASRRGISRMEYVPPNSTRVGREFSFQQSARMRETPSYPTMNGTMEWDPYVTFGSGGSQRLGGTGQSMEWDMFVGDFRNVSLLDSIRTDQYSYNLRQSQPFPGQLHPYQYHQEF
ncbi:INVS [Branchiostoma lanceolatum]|uniref:INVS protein n=1 Tax=Branchiostoma lanceolatum TaxID=7740 RepID=A0A8J9Z8Y4_BRALA|nr:INVS [Branchiostoma lanceolatum]